MPRLRASSPRMGRKEDRRGDDDAAAGGGGVPEAVEDNALSAGAGTSATASIDKDERRAAAIRHARKKRIQSRRPLHDNGDDLTLEVYQSLSKTHFQSSVLQIKPAVDLDQEDVVRMDVEERVHVVARVEIAVGQEVGPRLRPDEIDAGAG